MRTGLLTKMACLLIRAYQMMVSPLLFPSCRFFPSCSEYALTSFKSFGFLYGMILTAQRLGKCHPLHPGGFDPVPPSKERSI